MGLIEIERIAPRRCLWPSSRLEGLIAGLGRAFPSSPRASQAVGAASYSKLEQRDEGELR